MNENTWKSAIAIMDYLLTFCDSRLNALAQNEASNTFIALPHTLLDVLSLGRSYGNGIEEVYQNEQYKGIRVIPSHNMCAAIFYRGYSQSRESWMRYDVDLAYNHHDPFLVEHIGALDGARKEFQNSNFW